MAVKKKVVEIDTKKAQQQVDQLKESMAGLNKENKAATTSVKELRQELKAQKDIMLSVEEGTKEYNDALQKAANIQHTLKEQMEEVNANAMDFGQITGNVVKATGGIVAGFQAAKAAMNLFGIENETVLKSLEQMQSLMAITQAIPAIDDSIKAFKRLGLVIKSATVGMNGFKVALMSTGIGAAVVAVGGLISAFGKLKKKQDDYVEKQKEQIKLQKEKQIKAQEKYNESLKRELDLKERLLNAKFDGNDVKVYTSILADYQKQLGEVNAKLKDQYNDTAKLEAKKIYRQLNKELEQLTEGSEEYMNKLIEITTQEQKIKDIKPLTKEEIEALTKRQTELNGKITEYSDKLTEAKAVAAAEERKKAIEQEKKEIEELKKKYTELSFDISLYGASEYQKDLAELNKAEQQALKTVEDAEKKGVVTKEQAEKDKTAIQKYYITQRDKATKEEADRQSKISIEMIDTSYQLEQAKLQKQYDEKLISEKQFNDRKKELQTNYVQDYIDNIQFILDTEKNLTDEQILDLTNKINKARASLKENKETDPNVLTAKQISEAINESALALNDFSDNPAWGNILKNVATLTANWDTLQKNIKKGGKEAFTAYSQIAATALSAVAQMMNGLAAEQDTSNKDGFESAKKYQVAGATMSMLAGIASAWASSMQLMFPANVIVGSALSAMMLGTGIAQIAKIKSTQFGGGGNTSGVSATPNTSAVSAIQAPVQYTQDVQGASIEGAIKDTRVYVTEADISNTQKKVSVAESENIY